MRPILLSLCALAAAPAASLAQAFTFDSPNFTYLTQTPLNNKAPNLSGPLAGLTATFTAVQGRMFVFDSSVQTIGPYMSGQYLLDPGGAAPAILQIQFSQPITYLSFDFAVPTNGINLSSQTAAGTTLTPGVLVDPSTGFGGHVELTGLPPTTTVTLSAINGSQQLTNFAIDNLAVPSPGVIPLFAAATIASKRRRKERPGCRA